MSKANPQLATHHGFASRLILCLFAFAAVYILFPAFCSDCHTLRIRLVLGVLKTTKININAPNVKRTDTTMTSDYIYQKNRVEVLFFYSRFAAVECNATNFCDVVLLFAFSRLIDRARSPV